MSRNVIETSGRLTGPGRRTRAWHHDGVLKSAARLLLFRILPGRLFILLTIYDAWVLLRSIRRRLGETGTVQVNEPTASRTAPPRRFGRR
jgi:hypothetical protein